MRKGSRFLVAFLVFLGIVFLAQSRVAWAGKSSGENSLAQNPLAQPILAGHDDDGGTVKPPPDVVVITKSGKYSVGGFCTVEVDFRAEDLKTVAYIQRPAPRPLPDGVHAVRQACHVDHYQHDALIDGLTPDLGSATICFAAVPKKETIIYFYDENGTPPTWTALTTTVDKGIACAPANGTGVYIATFTNH